VNAGIFDITPGLEMSREQYRKMMSTNLDGAIFTIQEAIPHLNDGAVIIVNTSIAADLPDWNNAVYSASKKALENYAIGIASDPKLVNRGIRSVALSPGLTDTEIFKNALGTEEAATKFKDGTTPSIPAGRAGASREMAEAIEFIVQNEYFNAEVLDLNGGLKRAGRSLVPKDSGGSR
jgi:NAD(P)-dependent dehydrogenase (short-subunit alcohol dehydrogenase family)